MSALRALYRRAPLGMRLGLEPMIEACARAANPERALRVVHVAGTNGKGSVCAMLEAMARAAKIRTGLYTSPHLCRFAERIRIDGAPIDDDALERHLANALELGPDLSFFEAATLAAFLALADARVELAILEVGLGGRLDATNVVPCPIAAAITRVALDHQSILGYSIEEIAREKASIAKENAPLFMISQAPIMPVVRETCAQKGAKFFEPEAMAVETNLRGAHQQDNARLAYAVARHIGISDEACRAGLRRVDWPGRLETIRTPDGPVLLDAAHNPDGVRALAREIKNEKIGALVFGALSDKSWTEMIDALAPLAKERVYVAPRGREPTDPARIAARHAGTVADDVRRALEIARKIAGHGLVLVCGSIYLVGEIRAEILGLPCDPPIAL